MVKKTEKVEEKAVEVPAVEEKPKARTDGLEEVLLLRPFFLNGKQYGPGLCVVPSDAFHLWKSCI